MDDSILIPANKLREKMPVIDLLTKELFSLNLQIRSEASKGESNIYWLVSDDLITNPDIFKQIITELENKGYAVIKDSCNDDIYDISW